MTPLEAEKRFLQIYKDNITRSGSNKLLDYLQKTDFFIAPSSTRYHGAYNGGLVVHSVNVYDRLTEQVQALKLNYSSETIAIVALLHDVCKINCYKADVRNQKINGEWKQIPCYTFDEKLKFGGHSSKSVFLIMTFMKLSPIEASAINCHMGAYDRPTTDQSLSGCFSQNTLALLLSVADQYATYIDENEVNGGN